MPGSLGKGPELPVDGPTAGRPNGGLPGGAGLVSDLLVQRDLCLLVGGSAGVKVADLAVAKKVDSSPLVDHFFKLG